MLDRDIYNPFRNGERSGLPDREIGKLATAYERRPRTLKAAIRQALRKVVKEKCDGKGPFFATS